MQFKHEEDRSDWEKWTVSDLKEGDKVMGLSEDKFGEPNFDMYTFMNGELLCDFENGNPITQHTHLKKISNDENYHAIENPFHKSEPK